MISLNFWQLIQTWFIFDGDVQYLPFKQRYLVVFIVGFAQKDIVNIVIFKVCIKLFII